MGITPDDRRGLTVTGGLAYFGGPGNNYVTHSIAQMMDDVRKAPGSKGLVTANGNYVTKQSAGIYSTERPAAKPFAAKNPGLYQGESMATRVQPSRTWPMEPPRWRPIRSCTTARVPLTPFCLGAWSDGRRFIANTPADAGLLREMVERDMVGVGGQVTHRDGRNVFMPG